MASAYKTVSKTARQPKKAAPESTSTSTPTSTTPKIKQRVLILSSRGITHRHRHLLNDLYSLLPHSRKESKIDTKTKLYQLNELAELYNCNNILFFEARKGKDLYIWMSKPPNGPTVKLHLQNLHTMSELHFPGNCLKGSRPILTFDATFTNPSSPHLLVIKELLTQIFAVPATSRKTKPFIDHVMGFTWADGKIWIRVYEIKETSASASTSKTATTTEPVTTNGGVNGDIGLGLSGETSQNTKPGETKISLVEIGPRFVLTPIVILESSFGGPVIYENKQFVSPNAVRSQLRLKKAGRHVRRMEMDREGKAKRGALGLRTGVGTREVDELDDKVVFA